MLSHDDWPVPSDENLKRVGCSDMQNFIKSGKALFAVINEEMQIATGKSPANLNVLDFGAGCGRVSIPFSMTYGKMHCSDIDATAITFLKDALPDCICAQNNFDPPLDYPDSAFDAVYSVSVWTHLTIDSGVRWLAEIFRILKPGGVFLNSVMSHTSLVYRHMHKVEFWEDINNRDLRKRGWIFQEYQGLKNHPEKFPGVGGSYGMTFYDDQHIRSQWCDLFRDVDILPGCMQGQDLVILHKP
jgi:ubiquinone/menaquinone biosynthesis C-methylase UbiE